MNSVLRRLSTNTSPLVKWLVPFLAIGGICSWQLYGESQKLHPEYGAVLFACAVLGVIYVFVAREQFRGRADEVLDGGAFLRIRMGSLSDDVYLSNVESVEKIAVGYVTIARLRLRKAGLLGDQIEFFPLLKHNALGQNAVVTDLAARIVTSK